MSASRWRVLHVVEATTAGVRRYVSSLLAGMTAGWEMSVACPPIRETHYGDVAFIEDLRQWGTPIHLAPLRRSIGLSDAAAARALLRLVRREHFDLIHTHSSKAGFIGRLVARAAGIPVIHTPNGLYFLEQSGLKRRFYTALERLAGHASSRLIAVSEDEREVMVENRLAAPDRVVLIENGVDAARVRQRAESVDAEAVRRSLGWDGDGPLVGGVGRMARQKDPITFVRAAKCVCRSIPNARFVWIGDGELRAETERLAQQLGVPLTVTGHLENAWPVMRQLDAFVLPSLYEGLPFTLLEAMALDVPVIATDVIGTRSVLRDDSAGWRAPQRDAAGLANAVRSALTLTEEARRRAQAARQLVETRFSMQRMIAAHHELYSCVVSGRAA